MKPLLLKQSTSRKNIHKLGVRQQKRIINEVRNNLRYKNNVQNCVTHSDTIIQDPVNALHVACSSSTEIIENNSCCILPFTNIQSSSSDDAASSFFNTSSTESLFHVQRTSDNDAASTFFNISSTESFQKKLASCFLQNNLSHVQGNSILSLLRTHSCFQNLAKDTRTILNTPRNKVILFKVEPGEYIHFDLETEVIQALLPLPFAYLPNCIEIDFHADGCALDKSGSVHLWPIQCRVVNVKYTKPIIVGIYKGPTKPSNGNLFFEPFITDVKKILLKSGIIINQKKLPIRLRCFIADDPARSFILNHRGHTSSQPCSKCRVSGIRCEGRYIFPGINHTLRTNEEYERCVDEDHHKDGKSPLSMLPIGMVSQVPFEYMHLVCLGAMKKLFSAWICGKYSRSSKLPAWSISVMSKRLETIVEYCPSDFARRPRSLEACTKYKATEYRQFLLYTGPIVTYGLLNKEVYTHFLFLHAAIRILVSTSPSQTYLKFADLALQKFVKRCENIYGATFLSYNIHCLLHLANDVQQFGPLDTFSAFPYENHMRLFRKYCRKPGLPLQQIWNRLAEKKNQGITNDCKINFSIQVSMQHNMGPLPHNLAFNCLQYRKIMFKGILITLDKRDNCFIFQNECIGIVINILMIDKSYHLLVKTFLEVNPFYDIGISSSRLGIFICSSLSSDMRIISIDEVRSKCYKMPFWDNASVDLSSVHEENPETVKYVVADIIHIENY